MLEIIGFMAERKMQGRPESKKIERERRIWNEMIEEPASNQKLRKNYQQSNLDKKYASSSGVTIVRSTFSFYCRLHGQQRW